jgi:hypothetical protein
MVIGIWYASGGKKFNLLIKLKFKNVTPTFFQEETRNNFVSPPSGLKETLSQTIPGFHPGS